MKLFLAAMLLSVQVFAGDGYVNITDAKMRTQYDQAMESAFNGKTIKCVDIAGKAYEVGTATKFSEYSSLSVNSGAQPALVYSINEDNGYSVIASFSTSADFKTLKSVVFRVYQTQRVNRGTLVAPDFQNERVLTKQNSCTIP